VWHGKKKTVRGCCPNNHRERLKSHGVTELLLPSALLVTIQAQLLAPFMFVDFCLTAFFQ
jgi:hypothetical protein